MTGRWRWAARAGVLAAALTGVPAGAAEDTRQAGPEGSPVVEAAKQQASYGVVADGQGEAGDAAPANDHCAQAEPVWEGTFPFDNSSADTDGPEESCGIYQASPEADIWFTYLPACTGTACVDLAGSSFDTVLAVYQAGPCPPTGQDLIVCNDDYGGTVSMVIFPATAGQPYLVRVGGYDGDVGAGLMTLSLRGPDLNTDCQIDLRDLAVLASHWGLTSCIRPGWCEHADMDWSGAVQLPDFAQMATHWLEGAGP
jgi:hypothetical protein